MDKNTDKYCMHDRCRLDTMEELLTLSQLTRDIGTRDKCMRAMKSLLDRKEEVRCRIVPGKSKDGRDQHMPFAVPKEV
jgi:hypothetical protein